MDEKDKIADVYENNYSKEEITIQNGNGGNMDEAKRAEELKELRKQYQVQLKDEEDKIIKLFVEMRLRALKLKTKHWGLTANDENTSGPDKADREKRLSKLYFNYLLSSYEDLKLDKKLENLEINYKDQISKQLPIWAVKPYEIFLSHIENNLI